MLAGVLGASSVRAAGSGHRPMAKSTSYRDDPSPPQLAFCCGRVRRALAGGMLGILVARLVR